MATFTHDLAAATGDREIVALHPLGQATPYPLEVHHRIRRDERADYIQAARALDACVDVVSIQHEVGIWGGDDGAYVIDFIRALRVPAIATLHTVLADPTDRQRTILTELVESVAATVVMTRSAAALLTDTYGIDPRRPVLIPHGVPDLPLVDPVAVKPGLDVAGHEVILSFGLLGPGKGYELAIEALPEVVAERPSALYVVVGATHPDLIRTDGEAYRATLLAQVRELGMEKHVRFVDRFVGRVELTRWLQAADVFVTPYPDLAKTVSGTLSNAMGAGRAVVSTPYPYAAELLADSRGILVAPDSPAELARALIGVLGDDELRADIGRRAHAYSRAMVWSTIGAEYGRLVGQVAVSSPPTIRPASLLAIQA